MICRKKLTNLFLSFLGLLLIHGQALSADIASRHADTDTISMELSAVQLKDVIKKIYEETGYTIKIDETLQSMTVSGKFHKQPIERLLSKILKAHNIILFTDEKNKIIDIRTPSSGTKYKIGEALHLKNLPLEVVGNMEALNALNKKQNQAYLKSKNDPNAYIYELGITKAELDLMNSEQHKAYLVQKTNSDQVILGLNITKNELDSINLSQHLLYLEQKNNPDDIVTGTDMSRTELDLISSKQHKIYLKNKKDPDLIIQGTNMTRSELDAMNKIQNTNYLEQVTITN